MRTVHQNLTHFTEKTRVLFLIHEQRNVLRNKYKHFGLIFLFSKCCILAGMFLLYLNF